MLIKTQGIVIKHRNIGENDKILTILTSDLGVIEVAAQRSKSMKSSLASASQILSYSDFCLFKGKSNYIVNSAESINSFYSLRLDVIKLSLAGYFCELIGYMCKSSDEKSASFLKLILNTLYFLQEDKKDALLLKSIFELRCLSIAGFMPNLVCCTECATFEKELMYFFPLQGALVCEDCIPTCAYKNETLRYPVNQAVLSAMRYIVFSEDQRLFSFKLSGQSLEQLNYVTENYMYLHAEAKFNSLDMYKSLLI
ncbi:DNA repair protein RecO [Paludicola sp. MB14-C6]|uniref:DNA repair protein RecO n=1 Tax=Paludihabitans sp. MB14-C6 TaxID=3070656 RepID=UPI0027DBA162|nr:DNA repair protein RecO [Paludicola sp. MB14-C6]WMJ23406.1 DNA repair protein RecO [Paludicola sp. MB14-C6]